MKKKTQRKAIIGSVLIVGGIIALILLGAVRFSIAQEMGGRLEKRAVVRNWPAGTITVTTNANCQSDYGELAVVLNNPSDSQWDAFEAYGLDITVVFIHPVSGEVVSTYLDGYGKPQPLEARIDVHDYYSSLGRLPFSNADLSSNSYRGLVIAPNRWVHKTMGFNERTFCEYRFTIAPRSGPAPDPDPEPEPDPQPNYCAQDMKQCPDGSFVGRVAPNCEFEACPQVDPDPDPEPEPSPLPVDSNMLMYGLAAIFIVAAAVLLIRRR